MALGVLPAGSSFSYVHDPKGMPLITQLYELIGVPYFHLLPLFFLMIGVFYLWSLPFNRSVSFLTVKGSGKIRKRYGVIGSEIVLPCEGFIRGGYDLIGWSKESESNAAQYITGAEITLERNNIILYAVWQKIEQDESVPQTK